MSDVFFTESSRNIGGQEWQLLQQAQRLRAGGGTPLVLCRPGSRIAGEAAGLGLPTALVPFRGTLHAPSILRLGRLLRQHRPRALVCHSGHDTNISAVTVHLLHGLGLLPARPRLVRMRTYHSGPVRAFSCNRLVDHALTPSQALREQLLAGNAAIRPERVGVLYPGIDFAALAAVADAALPPALAGRLADAEGPRPVLVHAAMLRAEKGHAFMLAVVDALRREIPRLLYVAAGEGPEEACLRAEAARRGLDGHAIFPGTLRPVAPLLRRADAVVMPSLAEPLGMSQLEALGLGTPVVVSDVGGLPETVRHGHTGLVCPPPSAPGAVAAWVAALRRVLDDPLGARALAACGQADVQARFGLDANLRNLLAAL